MSNTWDKINLHDPATTGFRLKRGVGYVVQYHGQTVDLRECPRLLAERMADDPSVRWLERSPQSNVTRVPSPPPPTERANTTPPSGRKGGNK